MSHQHQVKLQIYDISDGQATYLLGPMLGMQMEGIWHTSIVVYDKEYYYGGGICKDQPGETPYGKPVKTQDLGYTEIPQEMFEEYLNSIALKFQPNNYDLINNNCNHFTDNILEFLLGQHLQDDIRNQAQTLISSPVGQMFAPFLSQFSPATGTQMSQVGTNNQVANPSTFQQNQPSDKIEQEDSNQPDIQISHVQSIEEFNKFKSTSNKLVAYFHQGTSKELLETLEQVFHHIKQTIKGITFLTIDCQAQLASLCQSELPQFQIMKNGNLLKEWKGCNQILLCENVKKCFGEGK